MALVTSRLARCVCGAPDSVCTSPGHDENALNIIDLNSEERVMSDGDPKPLKTYDVDYNGFPTQMKLNEDDAKRLNAKLVEPPATAEPVPPVSKARTAPNK